MNARSLIPLLVLALSSGCLTAVNENPIGLIDAGATGGGSTATGGGNTTTGGGSATGGGGGGGGANTNTVSCSTDNFCWERQLYGGTFHAIHGTGSSHIVAVGEGGIIATFNGTTWSHARSPTSRTLRGIWFSSPTLGWAVGDGGTILEWNGTSWALVTSPVTRDLFVIHGNVDTVYIGGVDTLMTRTAGVWTELAGVLPVTDSQPIVRVIAVVSSQEVFVGGAGGVNFLLRNNGFTWVDMFGASPSGGPSENDPLFGLVACGTSLFAGGSYSGEGNASWSRIGGSWSTSFSQGARVVCTGENEYLSFGSSFYGNHSIDLITATGSTQVGTDLDLTAAFAAAARDIWFVGANGALVHWTGTNLTGDDSKRTRQVYAFASDNVWAVRASGEVERFDGTSWSPVSIPATTPDYGPTDLYAPSRDEAWVLKGNQVLHLKNNTWDFVTGLPSSTRWVRGTSADNVWFSGGPGIISRWNGTTMNTVFLSSDDNTGPVHVTATQTWVPTWTNNGIGWAYRLNGANFTATASAPGWRFAGAGDDVYFTGVGSLNRWTGTNFVVVSEGVGTDLLASGGGFLYAVGATYTAAGQRNSLLRVAMGTTTATTLEMGSNEALTSLSVTPDGHVWATTSGGGVLHKRP